MPSPLAVVRNRYDVGSGNYLDIFCHNVHGLRTKSIEIFNNMYSFDFKMICLMEMLLNESHSSQNFVSGSIYGSDRDCHTKLHGGGVLIAVSEAVFVVKRRSYLECFQECVWV
jgi:hypothetical protein